MLVVVLALVLDKLGELFDSDQDVSQHLLPKPLLVGPWGTKS
jgi:hypothetical protein